MEYLCGGLEYLTWRDHGALCSDDDGFLFVPLNGLCSFGFWEGLFREGKRFDIFDPVPYLFVSTNKECVTTATVTVVPGERRELKFEGDTALTGYPLHCQTG